MSKFFRLVIGVSFVFSALLPVSCSNTEMINEKVSSLLLTQISLRKEQIAEPTPDRLEMMKNMGMRVDNLNIQKISIHLNEELSQSQIAELSADLDRIYQNNRYSVYWFPAMEAEDGL